MRLGTDTLDAVAASKVTRKVTNLDRLSGLTGSSCRVVGGTRYRHLGVLP